MNGEQADGRYADILRVADRLKGHYGSATNAFAHMVRESPLYVSEMAKMDSEHRRQVRKKSRAR